MSTFPFSGGLYFVYMRNPSRRYVSSPAMRVRSFDEATLSDTCCTSYRIPHGLYYIQPNRSSHYVTLRPFYPHDELPRQVELEICISDAEFFEATQRYEYMAVDIHDGMNHYRLSMDEYRWGQSTDYLFERIYRSFQDASRYQCRGPSLSFMTFDEVNSSTYTTANNEALTLQNLAAAYNSLSRVDGRYNELKGDNMFKKGDKVTNEYSKTHEIGIIIEVEEGNIYLVKFPSDAQQYPNGRKYSACYLAPSNMPQNDDIPKSLSVMERISASPEDKTLIKAGYLANGDLTQKAKDLISVLQYTAFKTDLVKAAQEELDEVAASK